MKKAKHDGLAKRLFESRHDLCHRAMDLGIANEQRHGKTSQPSRMKQEVFCVCCGAVLHEREDVTAMESVGD